MNIKPGLGLFLQLKRFLTFNFLTQKVNILISRKYESYPLTLVWTFDDQPHSSIKWLSSPLHQD
uniref:Uncharacterized protein n=1 Tax=Lepeophtheirus salmonis TaxID=72036 RepID=A0A0K2V7P6_LEPSM